MLGVVTFRRERSPRNAAVQRGGGLASLRLDKSATMEANYEGFVR